MLFWFVLIPFVIVSLMLTLVVLLQEPKQAGLGEGLGGGGMDFGTRGGTAGGLQRITIYLAVAWGFLALMLQAVPR
jgi:preprotein translocase subunit SecG